MVFVTSLNFQRQINLCSIRFLVHQANFLNLYLIYNLFILPKPFKILLQQQMSDLPTNYQDVVQLHRFACQLNLQNQTLKKHILKLQHCIQRDTRNHNDQMQKLRLYIEQCQNQIKKREERELYLMQVTQDLEQQKLNQILERKQVEKEIQTQRQILLAQRQRLVQTIQSFQKQNLEINQERKSLIYKFEEFKIKQQQKRHQILKRFEEQTQLAKQAQVEILRLKQIISILQTERSIQNISKENVKLQYISKNKSNAPQQVQFHNSQAKVSSKQKIKELQLLSKIKQQQKIIQILTRDTECLLQIISSQQYLVQSSS